ncbi:MAG: hypothetical protein H0W08_03740 [Acidobacteria bacterium]|nr:hypothetical protein [Acidobacteriota bacterium]
MGKRKTGCAWPVCLLAIAVHGAAPAVLAAEPPTDTACVVWTPPFSRGPARQEPAVARSGRIPGLGAVSASISWDNRQQLTLTADDFEVSRSLTPLTGEVEVTISGRGEEPLKLRLGGADRFSVSRSGRTFRGASDPDGIRALLGGRAISAFRERLGHYERQLMAGPRRTRSDDPHADGFLLIGAMVSSMAGDSTAVGRARDLIMQRIRGNPRSARFDLRDCVTDYERYLLKIDTQRSQCLDAANGRDSWYARGADRLGCEGEFMAQVLAGEGQFISCTAFGAIFA